VGDVPGTIRDRLRAALQRRLDRLDLAVTNAFRWVHGEADRLPGVHVDRYGDAAVARFDGDGARAFYGAMLGIRETAPDCVVRENGLLFEVSPGRAGKTGLFLDQRENREEVARRVRGRSVLDLFAYTGGFSLYAARAGARSTDMVDVAKPAIAAARRNFERNGLPLDRARFHVADAFEFLEKAAREGRTWHVAISDPPSFAPNKGAIAAARHAYARLHRLAAAVTAKGGLLCAASCSSHVGRKEFLATLGPRFRLEEVRGASFDHPVVRAFPEGDYLKFAIGRMP
jgi:23S rRNA (cytosine1962-C5)-methyltransferase